MAIIRRLKNLHLGSGDTIDLREPTYGFSISSRKDLILFTESSGLSAANLLAGQPAVTMNVGAAPGTITHLSGGGVELTKNAYVPLQPIDITQPWTLCFTYTPQPSLNGTSATGLAGMAEYPTRGFQIYQFDGFPTLDPPNHPVWVIRSTNGSGGQGTLVAFPAVLINKTHYFCAIRHDGIGNITTSFHVASGAVAQSVTAAFSLDNLTKVSGVQDKTLTPILGAVIASFVQGDTQFEYFTSFTRALNQDSLVEECTILAGIAAGRGRPITAS